MAIIKVNGMVERLFQGGRCVKLVEKSTSGGKEYTSRYTAWFEQSPELTEGQQVAVSGFVSVKQGNPWTDREGNERTSIDVNINSARVDGAASSATASATESDSWPSTAPGDSTPQAGAGDVWNAPGNFDNETPF